jgi:hypothetical protein
MLSAAVYPPFHIGTAAKRRKKRENPRGNNKRSKGLEEHMMQARAFHVHKLKKSLKI